MGEYVEQGRPQVTDIGAVASGGNTGIPVVSESHVEVADLLCEGPIHGIVSGRYDYYGTKGETGYQKVVTPDEGSPFGSYDPNNRYTAKGTTSDPELGFLRSIYWNQVPVVDEDGYYNFQSINVEWVNGEPEGSLPALNANMGGLSASEILDLSVNRNIGERLYGPDIKGNANAPSFTAGAELKDGTKIDKNAKTYTVLNRECSSLIVNIKVSALSESIRNENAPKTFKRNRQLAPKGNAAVGYGDIKARTVEYWIYYQPVFDEKFNMPSDSEFKNPTANTKVDVKKRQTKWFGPVTERVFGKIDQGYVRSTKINLEAGAGDYKDEDGFDGWRIRIVRLTPEPLTSFFRAVTFVDSIVEIYGTKLRYPFSAMVYSKFDASNFSRTPARAYDTKLQKIKIPNNYDPITKTYGQSGGISPTTNPSNNYGTDPNNFWDGNFVEQKVWCDNPAWCFYDMLTNPRYGLGGYLKESEIDKWSLYEIAQYCDVLVPDGYGSVEPRFTLNHLIISREEAYKLMNDLASAFRGLTYYSNGLVFAVQDAYKKPIYQLNNSNVVDGDFTYASSAKKARHTVALVRYIDKRNFFQPAIEYVSDEEAIKKYGIRQIETAAIGCTSRGQARRFGLWILASEKDETDSVSFKMGTAGAYLKPGDIVQIYDNNISPLKYSGRTNIVNGLAFAADPGESVIGNTAYNSVILDSALNFTADKAYKFSLLTPTYNYDASVEGLNSSEIRELKRSNLQTLYFSGAHTTTTTGDYRSDFELGGSGVNTQIFFKTGYPFDQSYFANADFDAPTGNQLDFDNYVITGYINSGVNVDGNSNTSVEYSGGYFNGENLVWSVEPYDETDKEFYSGNFSNFRIINSKENTDQTYDISALSYFSGKYDNVEQKVTFENPLLKNVPKCVDQAGITIGRRDPLIGGVKQEPYELLNFSFLTVGYSSYPGTVNSGIDYLVAIKTGKDFTTIPGDTPTDLGYNGTNATGYKLYHEPYHQLVIPGSDESQRQLDSDGLPSDIIEGNVFISEQVDHYLSVFAISPYGVLSPCGATGVLLEKDIIGTQSLVNAVDIYGLTTSDIPIGPGGTPGKKPTPSNAISIPGNTPNFNWQVGINTQFDEPGIYITNDEVEYRITIREPAKEEVGINSPNPNIYFEFTGFNSTVMDSPSFTFGTDYNNPDIYDAYNHSNSVAGGGAAKGKLYFRNDASGYLVQSGLSLPIRKFDIVVEAHDFYGRTSVGGSSIETTKNSNRVYDNTINPTISSESSEGWDYRNSQGYDILGCYIQPISGIVFPTSGNLLNNAHVSTEEAFNRDYPYLASIKTFPNGWTQLAIDESESSQEGNFILNRTQIDDIFAEAAGIVYYYTTGNEDVVEVNSAGNAITKPETETVANRLALWRAPQFTIDPSKIPLSISGRKFGNVPGTEGGAAQKAASVLIQPNTETLDGVDVPGYNETNKENAIVFRDYILLDPGQKVSDLLRMLPGAGQKSKNVNVDNAQFCIGAFDQLSYLSHFNNDGSAKTKTVTYTSKNPDGEGGFIIDPNATYDVPTIFTDGNIKFSKIGSKVEITNAANDSIGFGGNLNARYKTTESPTSFLVVEESLITTKDKDLSYKAWFDFNFQPHLTKGGEAYFPTQYKQKDWFLSAESKYVMGSLYALTNAGIAHFDKNETIGTQNIKQGYILNARNISNIQIIENRVKGPALRDPINHFRDKFTTSESIGVHSMWAMLYSTIIKVSFYEPLNTTKQPTPILQVYSNVGLEDTEQNYKTAHYNFETANLDMPHRDAYGRLTMSAEAMGVGVGWAYINAGDVFMFSNYQNQPQPNVRMITDSTSDYATSMKFEVTFGLSTTLGYDAAERNEYQSSPPAFPTNLKIVCGFLENSYHRNV
jgi:hypothetical protein